MIIFHFDNFQAITRVPDLFDIWSQAENSGNLANCHTVLPRSSTIFKNSAFGPKNAFFVTILLFSQKALFYPDLEPPWSHQKMNSPSWLPARCFIQIAEGKGTAMYCPSPSTVHTHTLANLAPSGTLLWAHPFSLLSGCPDR